MFDKKMHLVKSKFKMAVFVVELFLRPCLCYIKYSTRCFRKLHVYSYG